MSANDNGIVISLQAEKRTSGTSVTTVWTAVPEPATATLALAGLALLLKRRRTQAKPTPQQNEVRRFPAEPPFCRTPFRYRVAAAAEMRSCIPQARASRNNVGRVG